MDSRLTMPVGRVLSLVGGLALLAAYPMPWFGIDAQGQSVTLSGQFLGRFLATATDLRRFMPGAAGGPGEVAQLRGLVLLFPTFGGVAAAVAAVAVRRRRVAVDAVLVVLGAVPLAALAVGLGQLPAGARPEIGLWTIGAGALAVVLGAVVDWALGRRGAPEAASPGSVGAVGPHPGPLPTGRGD